MLLEADLDSSFNFQKKLNGFSDEQNERIQHLALTTHNTYEEIVNYVRGFSETCRRIDSSNSVSENIDSAIWSAEEHFR